MQRILTGLAPAPPAAAMAVPPARAAVAHPVEAPREQFAAGHGVRVSETARSPLSGKPAGVTRTTGVHGFGRAGIVASLGGIH